MKITEFIKELDLIYPKTLSCAWDTDGLQLLCDPERELRRVLVALDAGYSEASCAAEGGFDLLLTHHPMIFGGTKELTPSSVPGNRVLTLMRAGVSTASYHTRLDAGDGGVNDTLASVLGFDVSEKFGGDEMPCGGRIVNVENIGITELAKLVKTRLNATQVKLTGSAAATVRRIAIVGGAGKDFIMPALRAGCDAVITGEASYSSALDFAEYGIAIIEAGHYYTEFPVTARLAELVRSIAGAEAVIMGLDKQTII